MKREHSFITGMAIILCFMLWSCTRTYNYYATTVTKTVCDSSGFKKLDAENKKLRQEKYYIAKQRDKLRIENHELQTTDTNIFKVMRFDKEGKLVTQK